MTTFTIELEAGQLSLDDLRQSYFNPTQVTLNPATLQAVQSAHDTVRKAVDGGATLYGINTGFGRLAQTRVETEQLDQLQKNLVLSHSTGVG
ncbi:MAG: aromatic amino acid lyase, partial [Gammaproteobacteria bacterium]|nr:aromatic amino acid lyase [Gammaproteobacteria bacterium]